jgi:hypothetical protein
MTKWIVYDCPKCGGYGWVPDLVEPATDCDGCGGEGLVKAEVPDGEKESQK